MKPGDRIRVTQTCMGIECGTRDYTVEEFHHCLGFFRDEQHRIASNFTPLCSLLERGPKSENMYLSNYGEYTSNLVQGWMNICK